MGHRGKLRIAYARIAQETNALSPVRTELTDFRRTHFVEGDELSRGVGFFGTEAKGFLRNAELSGFVQAARRLDKDLELVPLFSAWAVPSGPLSRACFDELNGRLEEGLKRAGRLDGVYLCLHGAMGVDGLRDPETVLLKTAERASGGAMVGTSYDLHANLTKARVESALVSCAYRTNPHRDHSGTGARVAKLMLGALRKEISPVTAWRSLPMLLGGGMTLDFLPPMRSIFRRLSAMERDGALDASTFMCHPWNDDPDLGWSTLVHTDGDREKAEAFADELAERCWLVRHVEPPKFVSAQEAIEQARRARIARRTGIVAFCETSDVVSAGAPGDSPHVIRALLEGAKDLVSYAAVRDPEAIDALWSHDDGARVTVAVGARIDTRQGEPLEISGRILLRRPDGPFGRIVVLDAGHLKLVVTEGLPLNLKPSFYRDLGLRMRDADVVVVKNFFPFRLYYAPWIRKTIEVKTRGMTDLDAAHVLDFADPVHPKDPVDDWRPADERRRGLTAVPDAAGQASTSGG